MDIYVGPKAPAGKDANWVPTDPQRGFELMLRVKKEFFGKGWVLPDVEKISAREANRCPLLAEADMSLCAAYVRFQG